MIDRSKGKMKKNMFFILLFFNLLFQNGIEIKSTRNACPITRLVIPDKIIVSHDQQILMKMLSGNDELEWKTGSKIEPIKFVFTHQVFLKRIQISLKKMNSNDPILIAFQWIPKDMWWGKKSGTIIVIPDGNTHCYFIGYRVSIPDNVDVEEFTLCCPAKITIKSIRMSDYLMEKPMVECPMPQLQNDIEHAYNQCLENPNSENYINQFVSLLEKAMYKYDCRRSYDYEPVPAWWLCKNENIYKWFDYLSHMDSQKAKKLFGSELFRSTLDGDIAEMYYEVSLKIGNKKE